MRLFTICCSMYTHRVWQTLNSLATIKYCTVYASGKYLIYIHIYYCVLWASSALLLLTHIFSAIRKLMPRFLFMWHTHTLTHFPLIMFPCILLWLFLSWKRFFFCEARKKMHWVNQYSWNVGDFGSSILQENAMNFFTERINTPASLITLSSYLRWISFEFQYFKYFIHEFHGCSENGWKIFAIKTVEMKQNNLIVENDVRNKLFSADYQMGTFLETKKNGTVDEIILNAILLECGIDRVLSAK